MPTQAPRETPVSRFAAFAWLVLVIWLLSLYGGAMSLVWAQDYFVCFAGGLVLSTFTIVAVIAKCR